MTTHTRDLPAGTVTFFFSDVQDSTGLLQRLANGYREVLERHAEIIRGCLTAHDGIEVSTEGDSFFAVFLRVPDAVAAAGTIQQRLAAEAWPVGGTVAVRIGLHTGTAQLGFDNYVGLDVNRAARISAAGHGGQVVVSETVKTLAPDAAYSDLGEHILKGVERLEHLYQLDIPGLPQTFPPLRTRSVRPNNLPALASRIIGRNKEATELVDLLTVNRLVTITGPGGIGKTRLALEVANESLSRFEEGVFFVDLSAVTDPDLLMPAIASAVGVHHATDDGLAAALSGGERLLLLDNLEQLSAAAPRLADLMAKAAPLTVLATSQVPLRLAGETVMRLAPLASGEASPAVELFAARAAQADPSFDIEDHRSDVVRLVEALDGVPLAIELAAARANVLTPAQILDRLATGVLRTTGADRPDRHRSIEAAVEWSYGLLTPSQQQALQALSVFRGGATIDAVEAVLRRDPLDELGELVDRSLVVAEVGAVGKRFDLLTSVSLYATSRLDNANELAERHARWFCRLADDAHAPLDGDARARWISILTGDLDNLRATMDHLLVRNEIARGFDLLGSTWRFFQSSGRLDELDLWLGRFFAADETEAPTSSRARALIARAALHYWRGDYRATAADYEGAVTIAESLDDRRLQAEAWAGLASTRAASMAQGEAVGDAIEANERTYELAVELGDYAKMAVAEFGRLALGTVLAGEMSMPDRAALERIIDLYKKAGRLMDVAHTEMMLSEVDIALEDFDSALNWVLAGLETAERAGDTFTMAWALHRLAIVLVGRGDPLLGAKIAGASWEARERSGGTLPPPFFPIGEPDERARDAIGAAADAAFDEGKQLGLFEAIALARAGV
jgi:predicted ATPase/class 3 adenylate cyclase